MKPFVLLCKLFAGDANNMKDGFRLPYISQLLINIFAVNCRTDIVPEMIEKQIK